jgi:hypothetical protein
MIKIDENVILQRETGEQYGNDTVKLVGVIKEGLIDNRE